MSYPLLCMLCVKEMRRNCNTCGRGFCEDHHANLIKIRSSGVGYNCRACTLSLYKELQLLVEQNNLE